MTTKKRSDGVASIQESIAAAAGDIQPPECVPLRPEDWPFWVAITRARAEWNDYDLIQAANLARCHAEIAAAHKSIDDDGTVIQNKKGTPVMNPLIGAIEILTRRSIALSRSIQVHAQATQGDSAGQKKKNTAKKVVRDGVAQTYQEDEDDLLARPAH